MPESSPVDPPTLSEQELARYQWQLWMPGMDESAQQKLKNASVLISRVGGIGGLAALELAAAGVGRLILAHAGNLKASDLNRQLLQTHEHIGKPRIDSILKRLRDLNPHIELIGIAENVSPENAGRIVAQADYVLDAAPLFQERLAMNDAAMRLGKPMVECAMSHFQASVTTFIPGQTGCLRCYVPEVPPSWKRQFPVFGAVSGTAACIGAMEIIKLITGIGDPLGGQLLHIDHATLNTRKITLPKRPDCPACGSPSQDQPVDGGGNAVA